jgi:hypothetical protein
VMRNLPLSIRFRSEQPKSSPNLEMGANPRFFRPPSHRKTPLSKGLFWRSSPYFLLQ